MKNLSNSISTMSALIDLLETKTGAFTFKHSAEILSAKSDLKVSALMVTKWLRSQGIMESETSEQIASSNAIQEGFLEQSEATYGGKKRKQCRLTIKGHLLLSENLYQIYKPGRNS